DRRQHAGALASLALARTDGVGAAEGLHKLGDDGASPARGARAAVQVGHRLKLEASQPAVRSGTYRGAIRYRSALHRPAIGGEFGRGLPPAPFRPPSTPNFVGCPSRRPFI